MSLLAFQNHKWPAGGGGANPSRVTYVEYSNSTDGTGERDTSGSTITVGSESGKIVTCLFALGKNLSGDTFAFSSLVLTNGTDDIAPDVTESVAQDTNYRRVSAVAYWTDVAAGTWWIKYTPSVSLRYTSHYLALYQDRVSAETPVVEVSAIGSAGTTVNFGPTTTADNMMVAGMGVWDNGSYTISVTSGDCTEVDNITSSSTIGDVSSVYGDGLIATAGATATTCTSTGSARRAIASIAF